MRSLLRRLGLIVAIGAIVSVPVPRTAHADDGACPSNVVKNGDTGCHLTTDNGDNTGNYKCDDSTSYTLNCTTLKPVPQQPTAD